MGYSGQNRRHSCGVKPRRVVAIFNNQGDSGMLERYYITPESTYKLGGNRQVIYTPVIVVKDGGHAHIYVSGRTSRTLDGDVACKDDMRGQIREVCKAIQISLETVGASLADVTRTITYTTDMKAYFAAIDERFKYFKDPLPTSTLIGVAALAMPEMLVEIECEAIVEPERLRIPANAVRR
jgi:enamine deaminase RidA (YjgF/YER057c/UK114 family)